MKVYQFFVCPSFPIGFEGRIWDLIVLIPDHCLSIYFTTIPFHLVLSTDALSELAKSIPGHFLILSFYSLFFLPLLLFPLTMPCRIVFAKPEDLRHGQTTSVSVS